MGYKLDDIDYRIIEALRHDGRQANTEIARKLGITETMARHRIAKLIANGIVQVAARVNLARLGHSISVFVGITCDVGGGSSMAEVVQALSAIPSVRRIAYVTGRYDLLITATFCTSDELLKFLTEELRNVPGISAAETLHQLRVAKRDFNYWDPT